MSFFVRCISGNSLKGLVRDDDEEGGSGSTTPNDTQHGGSKFSSYSWKRLSAKSRSSLNSPKKPHMPVLSATSADGTGNIRASMEPVMERTRSALTDLEAVKFLVEDWSHKHWRPATPQDQERFDRLEQSDIKPLVALGEGAYGSVNLCRIAANVHSSTSPANSTYPTAASAAAASPFAAQAAARGKTQSFSGAASSAPPRRAAHKRSASTCASHRMDAALVAETANGSAAATISSNDRPSDPALPPAADDAAAAPSLSQVGSDTTVRAASGESADCSASGAPALDADGALPDPNRDGSAQLEDDGEGGEGAEGEGECAGEGEEEPSCVQPASSLNDPQLIVAVKRVPLGWNQERELMQLHRCQQCPFIVRLFGFVDDGSEHCSYVMEWAEGGDLSVMLSSLKARRGANKERLLMSEASARYYMGCLLLALEFLHANGLLHRDIKPSNLLLTSDGTAKLADLGFTVALDANGQTVGCCGTTGYIAPEVYAYGITKNSRNAYGIPADLWSSGATLYQILTGQVVTDQPEEMLKKGWRPPPHPRFSHHLQDLLNRLLAVKPHARPQSAASVMRHPWFTGFDWPALREGRMKAPYVPSERRRKRQSTFGADAPGPQAADAAGSAAACGGSGGSAATAAAADSTSAACGPGGSGGFPPPTCLGRQPLEPVIEGVPSPAPGDSGQQQQQRGGVQRCALSGGGEGSVKCGREGLVRPGSSFETVLGTVPPAEAATGRAGSPSSAVEHPAPTVTILQGGRGHGQGQGQGHGHGLAVRFAVGVAECA